ncbi:EAL domain-containing protein [bacterium]|nr:EAL domain-containing protein [bacterium]
MRFWQLTGRLGTGAEIVSKLVDPLPFRLGRRAEATLTIPRSTVSGIHAELFTMGDRLFVRDLNSTNGTFINGHRLESSSPLEPGDVLQLADVALRISAVEEKTNTRTVHHDFNDHALARVLFDKLLINQQITPHFQPIVEIHSRATVAFEVLARSTLPGLESPGQMFAAAADLELEDELSNVMRIKGVQVSQQFHQPPPIFLNTHPTEFADDTSWEWLSALREMAPHQSLTIEVHEGAVTNVAEICRFREALRGLNIGLAFDDFGAGQARIAEIAEVRPDYLKFDRQVVTKLDQADPARLKFIRNLIDAVQEIGVIALAEGIETEAEYEVCRDLGFTLGQGFWLGLPKAVDAYQDWHTNTLASDTSLRLLAPASQHERELVTHQ